MMKLTKFGHACLFIDNGQERLVVDPGKFSELPKDLTNIRTVVVSEEHGDHFDLSNLQKIVATNPDVRIFTTASVGKQLDEAKIAYTVVEGTKTVDTDGFNITLSEGDHAIVHEVSPCRVLTVSVGDFLYYPSDSFIPTHKKFVVLAIPTSGPWHKVTEMINFANSVQSDYVLATHNGLYNHVGNQITNYYLDDNLTDKTRTMVHLQDGESKDFA